MQDIPKAVVHLLFTSLTGDWETTLATAEERLELLECFSLINALNTKQKDELVMVFADSLVDLSPKLSVCFKLRVLDDGSLYLRNIHLKSFDIEQNIEVEKKLEFVHFGQEGYTYVSFQQIVSNISTMCLRLIPQLDCGRILIEHPSSALSFTKCGLNDMGIISVSSPSLRQSLPSVPLPQVVTESTEENYLLPPAQPAMEQVQSLFSISASPQTITALPSIASAPAVATVSVNNSGFQTWPLRFFKAWSHPHNFKSTHEDIQEASRKLYSALKEKYSDDKKKVRLELFQRLCIVCNQHQQVPEQVDWMKRFFAITKESLQVWLQEHRKYAPDTDLSYLLFWDHQTVTSSIGITLGEFQKDFPAINKARILEDKILTAILVKKNATRKASKNRQPQSTAAPKRSKKGDDSDSHTHPQSEEEIQLFSQPVVIAQTQPQAQLITAQPAVDFNFLHTPDASQFKDLINMKFSCEEVLPASCQALKFADEFPSQQRAQQVSSKLSAFMPHSPDSIYDELFNQLVTDS